MLNFAKEKFSNICTYIRNYLFIIVRMILYFKHIFDF